MSFLRTRTRTLGAGALVLTGALALSACGSSDSTVAADTSTATAAAAGDAGALTPQAALAKAYKGVTGQPPTSAPVPAKDKSIWIVSCGQSQAICSSESAATTAAATTLGWTAKTCDGQLSPPGWQACIRQGVSAGSDAIVAIGLDCPNIKGALQEAKAAKVVTINVGGSDCGAFGDTDLFAGSSPKLPDMTGEQFFNLQGALQADYLIGKTDGKAKALYVQFTDAKFGSWLQAGFTEEMKKCSGCTITSTVQIGNADVGGGTLPTKVSTALLQNPTINAVAVPLDGWFFAGLAQALASSGRSDSLTVVGAIGTAGNYDLIRGNKGEDATAAWSGDWDAWSGIDAAVRVFAGQPTVPSGVGLQVVDATTNMPAPGQAFAYSPVVDFAAAYKKIWGVG
ncbi:MAG TPA: substrate-binding domain-containing protein [Mycobacteriales bacterium]|jgi:ribose transport system substrate-binding protein|nr:substrate-binding domain-containing protein [Mycobacteriales bacterium]